MENYKNRLKEYIRTDIVYKDFMENKEKTYYDYNDYEQFCIEHCEDIKKLLEENEKLEKELKETSEKNE